MMTDTFVDWINEQLQIRGWSMREFGRQIGVSPSHTARIVNGEVIPSVNLIDDIARALDTSAEIVMRKAGLLPPERPETADRREASYLFSQLPDDEQAVVLTIMRALLERRRAAKADPQTDSV